MCACVPGIYIRTASVSFSEVGDTGSCGIMKEAPKYLRHLLDDSGVECVFSLVEDKMNYL